VKLFTVCIVHYGDEKLLERCCDSISAAGDDCDVIVWINGTKALVQRVDAARIWYSSENLGFSEPANRLAAKADTDYIVFLNSDAVVGPGWLEALFEPFVTIPRVGVTGPKGGCRTLTQTGDGAAGERIDYIEGSCMMVPKHLFMKMGGFDTETFRFAYAEDADFCLRIRELGWKVVEVDVPGYQHERAVTSKVVEAEGIIDIKGLATINNMRLLARWGHVIRGGFKRRIVVSRKAARGDVFQLTALARIVADRVPHWKLYADTPWPELFENNPLILPVSDLAGPADYVDLDGAYESRPNVPIAIAYAQAIGVPQPIPLRMPELYLTDEEKLLAPAQGDEVPQVIVHPGFTGWPGKDAPRDFWEMLIFELRARSLGPIGVVGDQLTPMIGDIDLRKVGFRRVGAFIGGAKLFVGVDSFPAHLAYAMRTPAVVLFGAVPPERVIVERAFAEPVRAEHLACLGCHLEGPQPRLYSGCARLRIDVHTGISAPCMTELSADHVLQAIEKVTGWRKTMPSEVSKSPGLWERLMLGARGLNLACGLDRGFGDTFDRTPYMWADKTGDVRERLPYATDSYNWVLTSHNLEDLPVPDWTCREILRILKPGGRILAYVPTKKYDEQGGYNEDHVRVFDEPQLLHLLKRSGFEQIQIVDDQEGEKYSILGVGVKP